MTPNLPPAFSWPVFIKILIAVFVMCLLYAAGVILIDAYWTVVAIRSDGRYLLN